MKESEEDEGGLAVGTRLPAAAGGGDGARDGGKGTVVPVWKRRGGGAVGRWQVAAPVTAASGVLVIFRGSRRPLPGQRGHSKEPPTLSPPPAACSLAVPSTLDATPLCVRKLSTPAAARPGPRGESILLSTY